jgi:hypothetical protein
MEKRVQNTLTQYKRRCKHCYEELGRMIEKKKKRKMAIYYFIMQIL